MKSSSNKSHGFTIVELIVVIVVIGILAGIGIVSYSGSQNRAKKESYNATAQQAKLKLAEYYTDNNKYPDGGAAVLAYLNATGSESLATTISTSGQYNYQARTKAGGGCTEAARNCQDYTITVSATNWRGTSPTDDVVVKP
ncbi:prepilin-type N-terminal cleavage/methylation domain-containing protein [bacterium]|nr:MAG: prepilin-type N-terminal cleavage/methylation domain-containing protein [bacterium]